MANIYFYPKIDYKSAKSPNPYSLHFEQALKRNNNIVNKKKIKYGVLDFFKYFFQTDIYVLNWIEDLPIYRFGKAQMFMFGLFLLFSKLFQKKIIWVLHNKYSHYIKRNYWTDLMYSIMMKYSDRILTHSRSGIEFVNEFYPKQTTKISYLTHPVMPPFPLSPGIKKEYDVLIWGTVFPYKGVVEFLQHLRNNRKESKLRIFIVGRCYDKNYKLKLKSSLSEKFVYKDAFYEIEEIAKFANQSKYILFTHNSETVLSSGALMDSIRMNVPIIGPNHGAFKDLKTWSFIDTYSNHDDILTILKNYNPDAKSIDLEIERFCQQHSWESFAEKLQQIMIDKLCSSHKTSTLVKDPN